MSLHGTGALVNGGWGPLGTREDKKNSDMGGALKNTFQENTIGKRVLGARCPDAMVDDVDFFR